MRTVRIPGTAIVLALFFTVSGTCPRAGATPPADFVFVTTTDFSTGSASVIDLATKNATLNVASIHSDATARYYNGLVYVVNRLGQDNVQRLDPAAGFSTVGQFSTGNGSNPHDIVCTGPGACYVTRYETTELWKMNPSTGATLATISLASLADADGIPEMDQLVLVGNTLFVSVQRLDRNNFFSPTATSFIAVVDVTTDTLVDTNPSVPGIQPITTARPNPFSEMQLDGFTGAIYLSEVGFFGVLDGGVEAIDPVTYQSLGMVFTEAAAGGDILDVEIVSPDLGYAIVSTPSFFTHLVSFNPQTGVKLATVYAPSAYVLQDVERGPDGNIYLTDRTATNPGVRCYDAQTGTELTTGPISTGLPPFDLTFNIPVQTGAGEPAPRAATLDPNYPNPFNPSTTVPFTLARGASVRLQVFDPAGRFVRTLVDGPVAAGAHHAVWNGTDAAGRPVASGVYFARLEADGFSAVRKLVLLK